MPAKPVRLVRRALAARREQAGRPVALLGPAVQPAAPRERAVRPAARLEPAAPQVVAAKAVWTRPRRTSQKPALTPAWIRWVSAALSPTAPRTVSSSVATRPHPPSTKP